MPSEQTAGEPKVGRHPISLRQAVSFAWSTFQKRYRLFSAVLLTMFAAWIGLEAVVIAGQRFGILLWIVAHLSFLMFLATVEIGFFQICLALYDGKEAELADAFPHWSLGLKFLVGQIVFLLMVLIGLVLLVGPGVYLGIRYSLFGFCMADGEADLKDSFRRSATLTAGRWVDLLRIFAALLLLNVLGASLLGLGLFIAVPLSALVTAAIYRQLGAC